MKQKFFDPCRRCIENPCLGQNCPVANAEEFGDPPLLKERKLQVPPNIRIILKRLGIIIPDEGEILIKLAPTETGTYIEVKVNKQETKAVRINTKIPKKVSIKYIDGSLIKVHR